VEHCTIERMGGRVQYDTDNAVCAPGSSLRVGGSCLGYYFSVR
jgi:hypothetical protein